MLNISSLFRQVLRIQSATEKLLSNGSSILVIGMMLLTSSDIIMRYVFNNPIVFAYEVTEFMLVCFIMFSVAYVQQKHGHIALEFLYEKISPKRRLLLDILSLTAGFLMFLAITCGSAALAWQSWLLREFSAGMVRLPVYPFKFVIVVGAGIMCIRLLLDILAKIGNLLGIYSPESSEV